MIENPMIHLEAPIFEGSLRDLGSKKCAIMENMDSRFGETHTYKLRTAETVYASIRDIYYPELSYLHNKIVEVIRNHVKPS
ncbi:hypothetical protein DFP98_15711 [Cohnella phaseoli]|uniref:Uncharacterized protein n=1 Tax=Cohnella phaseoli TaxID=456490 RepID=A0A3D9HT14_9BACL|nr:hypothetical protein DFP98_15711 [Cohnella phaseoli]